MKLEDLKFYKPSRKDLQKMKKLLERLFPETFVVTGVYKPDITIYEDKINITQSVHNWILTIAAHYYLDDPFNLYYWQGNNPVDDLIDAIKEDEENE